MKNYPRKYACAKHPIVDVLRAARKEKNMRQDVLSLDLGYHQETISRWERGYKFPSFTALKNWCDALDCELVVRPRA